MRRGKKSMSIALKKSTGRELANSSRIGKEAA